VQLVSRRLATAMIVVLAAALGTRMAAGGRPSGGPSGGAQSGSRGTALVTRIVDGDTAVLEKLGKSRFIGVDTPEVHGRAECFGAQASAFAKRVLAGRRIRYSVGMAPRDRYGRALIYVWLQDGRSRSHPTCATPACCASAPARLARTATGCGPRVHDDLRHAHGIAHRERRNGERAGRPRSG